MMQTDADLWVVDFEFMAPPGNPPHPICFVAKNLKDNKIIKQWVEKDYPREPPYSINNNSEFIAYFSSAEIGCHLSLGWGVPKNILDLYVEFRVLTNGNPLISKNRSLLDVAAFLGIDGSATIKEKTRERIIQGSPYNKEEREDILNYCESDVLVTEEIFKKIASKIDFPRAHLRGRYMAAVAIMEQNGIPIDICSFKKLMPQWDYVKTELIKEINPQYDVYEGTTFKAEKFEQYLKTHHIPWDYTPSGRLSLSDDVFKIYCKIYPELIPLRQLRYSLGQLKLHNLTIGEDGRNRALISPFRSKTGRNQPSSSAYIFGLAKWIRPLIKPKKDYGIAYIDYAQQEVGISAALSQDPKLIDAYLSGDPYLSFGKQAGLVPKDATKESHYTEREKFKICFLATQYGMGENTFAKYAGISYGQAHALLKYHRRIFYKYWEWSDKVVDIANLKGTLHTVLGWNFQTKNQKESSIRNFLMQAHGAEILRLACCLTLDAGIKVCAPIHDALLIEAPFNKIEDDTERTKKFMTEAGEYVLNGFPLRADAEIIQYPNRYLKKGTEEEDQKMWDRIGKIIGGWCD